MREVSVDYGPLRAVSNLSLSVHAGEVVALLGPSGCGKSTALRAIAGLEPLASGSIEWNGQDMRSVPVHRRGFGLMFQDHALFPHKNVADNVGFGLRMLGLPKTTVGERAEKTLELVGLAGFGDRTIGTLSGGQAQRVALARALAPQPQLLLLDEPLGSLDRALRDRLVQDIRAVITNLGITAIHVTHDHDEAVSIADSLALLREGALVRAGPVDELLANPGDVSTAASLGVETVLSGPIDSTGGIRTSLGDIPVSGTAGSLAYVLVRPSAVTFDPHGVTPATVDSVRHRSGSWLATCTLREGERIVAQSTARPELGATVRLNVNLSAATQLAPPATTDEIS